MKIKHVTVPISFVLAALAGLAVVALMPGYTGAFEEFGGGGGTRCGQCHGQNSFKGNGEVNHDLHTPMVTDCNTCHPNGPGSTPVLTYLSGVLAAGGNGVGCKGCHNGPGLRLRHENSPAGPGPGTCITAGCHSAQAAPSENTLPPYYGTASVNGVDDPCNTSGLQNVDENWDGNTMGLDNDGDLFRDGDDTDCQGTPPPPANPAVTDIKANGLDGQITVARQEPVTIDVGLTCNDHKGTVVDYVAVVLTPFGWYHYDVTGKSWIPGLAVTTTAPCIDLARTILSMKLPGGVFTFFWAVDMTPDGAVTPAGAIKDRVKVIVQ